MTESEKWKNFGVSLLKGMDEGLKEKTEPKKEKKQNSKQYPWKRRKRR